MALSALAVLGVLAAAVHGGNLAPAPLPTLVELAGGIAIPSADSADDPAWPQFRGPGGLGIAPNDQAYPAELDTSRNLLWKTQVSQGHSSPCIWGNSIFITGCSGKVLETICLDRGDGKIRWRQTVEVKELEKTHSMNSHASPTPVCDGKRVYVYFGSFGLLAYDFDGKEIWRKPLPIPDIKDGTGASPILANDMLVIQCEQAKAAYVLAVNRDTGETVWQHDRGDKKFNGFCTPVLWKHGEQEELIIHGSQGLASYDLKDGQQRWQVRDLRGRTGPTPTYAGETLFATVTVPITGDPVNPIELPDFQELLDSYDRDGDKRISEAEIPEELAVIYRFGPVFSSLKKMVPNLDADKDGALSEAEWEPLRTKIATITPEQHNWSKPMDLLVAIRSGAQDDATQSYIKWSSKEGIGQVPSPLVYRQRLYLVKEGGIVTCFRTETGDRVFSGKLGPRTYFTASPVAADGKIYICSQPGMVIVIQAGDEFKVLTRNKIGEHINATPALVAGKVYVRAEKHVFAFGG
jgi:outer membrane protein assembly factor BamB